MWTPSVTQKDVDLSILDYIFQTDNQIFMAKNVNFSIYQDKSEIMLGQIWKYI